MVKVASKTGGNVKAEDVKAEKDVTITRHACVALNRMGVCLVGKAAI